MPPRMASRRCVSRALDEIDEGSPHRGGIRVVRVVDHEAVAGERQPFAAPAGELDARGTFVGAVQRQPERRVRVHRRERVLRLVARAAR